MLHKTALARADGSGWHYVLSSSNGGYPIGLCRDHDPHPTQADARECYGRYVREHTIVLDVDPNARTGNWTTCAACDGPANRYARYGDDGYGWIALCLQHQTVDDVIEHARLAGPAGDSWVS